MLAIREYVAVKQEDPIRFYNWPLIGKLYRRRVEMCLAECPGGQRILEVGFGSGVTFLNLSERYAEIHGIDLTARVEAVREVFKKKGVTTFLSRGNVLDIPYPDNFFDTALLVSVLEHLRPEEQDTAFAELSRVLKPNGTIVYGVPIDSRGMVVAFRVLGYDIKRHHFSSHKQVRAAASKFLYCTGSRVLSSFLGPIYEICSFHKIPLREVTKERSKTSAMR